MGWGWAVLRLARLAQRRKPDWRGGHGGQCWNEKAGTNMAKKGPNGNGDLGPTGDGHGWAVGAWRGGGGRERGEHISTRAPYPRTPYPPHAPPGTVGRWAVGGAGEGGNAGNTYDCTNTLTSWPSFARWLRRALRAQ